MKTAVNGLVDCAVQITYSIKCCVPDCGRIRSVSSNLREGNFFIGPENAVGLTYDETGCWTKIGNFWFCGKHKVRIHIDGNPEPFSFADLDASMPPLPDNI